MDEPVYSPEEDAAQEGLLAAFYLELEKAKALLGISLTKETMPTFRAVVDPLLVKYMEQNVGPIGPDFLPFVDIFWEHELKGPPKLD